MKFFAVFAAVLAVACAHPYTWTLESVSQAILSPLTSEALKPILEQARDHYLDEMTATQGYVSDNFPFVSTPASIITAPGVAAKMSLNQLDQALSDESYDAVFKPYLTEALNHMVASMFAGEAMPSIEVYVPSLELSFWTLPEISAALEDPMTSAEFKPYLTNALNHLMDAIFSEKEVTGIVIAAPATAEETNLVDTSPALIPSPAPASSGSPLVELIVNVQQSDFEFVPPNNIVAPAPPGLVTPGWPIRPDGPFMPEVDVFRPDLGPMYRKN
ncbi:hypothetical protein ABMA27_005928 [Loxostege sticticalis]|uniref:Uncharacterized protein n=1 Tax=Loxostege sticticalis TaxID=481309 RepID=A0ABR3HHC8_LOXSC